MKDIEKFEELIRNSSWLSDFEKASLTRESKPLPPAYLVEAAFEAVKEEAEFYEVLKEKLPDVYDYLARMKEWLDRDDKTPGNFPGFPDRFEPNILDTILPLVEEKPKEDNKEPIDSDELSSITETKSMGKLELPEGAPLVFETKEEEEGRPGETISEEMSPAFTDEVETPPSLSKFIEIPSHPNTDFDETRFRELLAGSLSLTTDEKIKIIEAIPKLSQYQIDELIKIFEEEKSKFGELAGKHPDEIKKLQRRSRFEWKRLERVQSLSPASKFIKFPPHPNTEFDENRFLLLLAGSISLTADEKVKIIESIPILSKYQIDELIKIFEEEMVKFGELAGKHKVEIRKLQVQHAFEWEKGVCLRFMLDTLKEKTDINTFFNGLLKIENYFQRYMFGEATEAIKEMLGTFPGLVFLYEYYFQALKTSDELDLNAVKMILKEFFKEVPPGLYDVLCLFFEFEQIYLDGKRRFLEKIDDYKLPEDYAYVEPYLLSKYFLYYGEGGDSLQEASEYISEAIGNTGTAPAETLLFLYHHQIKVFLAKKDFTSIRNLLSTLFKKDLPLYYRYLQLLESCFNTSDSDYEGACKYAMETFIRLYSRENNLKEVEGLFAQTPETVRQEVEEIEEEKSPDKDRPDVLLDEDSLAFLHDEDEPDIEKENIIKEKRMSNLWHTVQELKQVISELGFVDDDEYKVEREVDRLTGLKKYDEARRLIEANMSFPQSELQYYNLLDELFILYRKQEILDTSIQLYRDYYVKRPDFKNTYSYLLLLNNMERKYRYEAQEVALFMVKKYYFLPSVYGQFFNVEHYKFTKESFSKEAEKSLYAAIYCGLTPGLFGIYAEYYRWQRKDMEGNLFGLMDGVIFNGSFKTNIICSYRSGWKEIALASFLIGLNRFPWNDNIYNCFSIVLDKKESLEQFVSLLFYVKANNVHIGKSGTLLTNKSIPIFQLSNRYQCFSKNSLYAPLQAVTADPHHTWLSYIALLTSAERLGKKELYLPVFYTAVDYECPQIKDEHLLKVKQIVSGYLEKKDFPGNFSLAVFLARALIDDKPYWIEERNILDTEGAAFDSLIQAEKFLETGEIPDFFLGDHAYEEFLSLTSQDWYLLYRFPGETYEEKYKRKLDALRKLEHLYPLSRHRKNLKMISREKTIKDFVASLNSGRVHIDTTETIENSKAEVLRTPEEYYQSSTPKLKHLHDIQEKLNTLSNDVIQTMVGEMGKVYDQMEPTHQVKLKSDLFLLFRANRKKSNLEKKLNDIFFNYGVKGKKGDLILKLKEILEVSIASRHEYENQVEELQLKIKEDEIETGVRIFQSVKNIHVLEGSEMFQSFRKRIRHGWLIAYLKDCFSRHDLYMDSEAGGISPAMRGILDKVTVPEARKEMEDCLLRLVSFFYSIANRLDKEILLIKSAQHPEGLLDYNFPVEDLKGFVKNFLKQYENRRESLDVFIERCCEMLDRRTLRCFENMKNYLEVSVYEPLNAEIGCIRETICKWEDAFQPIPGERDKILSNLDDAASTFKRNIELYKTWFDFYRSAVRDFTLPEIIEAAKKMVWDINLGKINEKNIAEPVITIPGELEAIYFKGVNFPDLLEVFKILFQNVVYHAVPPAKERKGIKIEISATYQNTIADEAEITVEFTSPHAVPVDTQSLMTAIKSEELRRQTRLKRHGGGLAIIEESLMRLKGAVGQILAISWNNREKKFKVRFNISIKEKGAPVEHTRDEILQCIPLAELINEAKTSGGLNILVVEDQIPKYQAIKNYLHDLLAEIHVTHTVDVETTCRLLLEHTVRFDMIILDMTLPQDPSFDSYLEPLAGLSVLKVMKLRGIHIPTILVTQYSNWSTEAYQDTRVFIENLENFCSREYENFYKGTIRFSHTESAWRKKLKDVVYSLGGTLQYFEEKGDYSRAVEFYEKELERFPSDIGIIIKLAESYRQAQNYSRAEEYFSRALELEKEFPPALEGLALLFAEMGDAKTSEEYFQRFKLKKRQDADLLREKILDAKLKTINQKRQDLYQNEMMATLGQMAGGMAHEFNTPLQAIKFIAQNTLYFIGKNKIDKREIDENLKRIVEVVDTMAAQVSHIKALAKDDRLKTSQLDLNFVIRSAFNLFEQQLKNRTIKTVLEFQENLPTINANRYRLEQAFINLIQNSMDALEPVKGRKKEIIVRTIHVKGETPAINVYFEDTGTGIRNVDKEKIFEPFFTGKAVGEGMGLGLSIVREIITELGGTIKLRDESTRGVTFVMEIPVKKKKEV